MEALGFSPEVDLMSNSASVWAKKYLLQAKREKRAPQGPVAVLGSSFFQLTMDVSSSSYQQYDDV